MEYWLMEMKEYDKIRGTPEDPHYHLKRDSKLIGKVDSESNGGEAVEDKNKVEY